MSTTIEVPVDQQAVIQSEVQLLVKDGGGLKIVDQQSYDSVIVFLKKIKEQQGKIDEFFDPNIKAAHSLHKNLVAQKKAISTPLEALERGCKDSVRGWDAEQEQKRLEGEREAAALQAKADEEARLASAIELEKQGATKEEVEQVLVTPTNLPAPILPKTYVPAQGVSIKTMWRAEVDDVKLLCQAIVEGKVPPSAVEPNLTILNGLARSYREAMNIPGVRAVSSKSVSSRA